jgi:N6-adenosine-specific RNA methylase IME4
MTAAPERSELALTADAAVIAGAAPCSAFRCVVADPPWELPIGKSRTANGEADSQWKKPEYAERYELQYPQMSVEEICALKVPAADDAHLYIWTINRYIEETYDVARAWGFEPSTMLYWLKQPMGLGLGGAFVPCVEPILFARRGKLPWKSRCDRNWWGWPRGKHSAKPEGFQTVVESVSPGPYLEMFARRKRPGWQSWGNEVTSDVILTRNDEASNASGRTE